MPRVNRTGVAIRRSGSRRPESVPRRTAAERLLRRIRAPSGRAIPPSLTRSAGIEAPAALGGRAGRARRARSAACARRSARSAVERDRLAAPSRTATRPQRRSRTPRSALRRSEARTAARRLKRPRGPSAHPGAERLPGASARASARRSGKERGRREGAGPGNMADDRAARARATVPRRVYRNATRHRQSPALQRGITWHRLGAGLRSGSLSCLRPRRRYRSRCSATASTSGRGSNRTGSVAGSPVSRCACLAGPPGLRVAHVVGIERDADDLGRMDRRRRSSRKADVLGERRDPEPGCLAVVADVLPGALVAEDHRVGAGAVQQAQGDGGVAGMVDAPLPFDQHDVGVPGSPPAPAAPPRRR